MIAFILGIVIGLVGASAIFLRNSKALPALQKVIAEIEKAKQGLVEAGEASSDVISELTKNIKSEMEKSGLESFVNSLVKKIQKEVEEVKKKIAEKTKSE